MSEAFLPGAFLGDPHQGSQLQTPPPWASGLSPILAPKWSSPSVGEGTLGSTGRGDVGQGSDLGCTQCHPEPRARREAGVGLEVRDCQRVRGEAK